jgi:hypothetical protein
VSIYEETPSGDTQKFFIEDRTDCVLPQVGRRLRILDSASDYIYLNFHNNDSNNNGSNIPRINLRFTVRPESSGDEDPLNELDSESGTGGVAAPGGGGSTVMLIIMFVGGVC